jgi:hypothetical protein
MLVRGRFASWVIVAVVCGGMLGHPFFSGPAVSASDIDALPYKQLLDIPVDTGDAETHLQPVDMRVSFVNPCWARNETENAIRVAYDDGSGFTELESQTYDLTFIDETHVSACSIVFLIPRGVDGTEKYYVLYDDGETSTAGYPDHVTVEDTHYFYEPISGQKIDFDYYKITEDGYVVYGVCQRGVLLGNGVSQMVAKLKLNSTEFETVNTDQLASFAMTYSIESSQESTGTDWATDITKSIMIDGNLMIRLRIAGPSPEGTLLTDNIYTYYYCPSTTKRLAANVNHDVLQPVTIEGNQEEDGTYAHLTTFKSRSATIEKMNIGVILPSLHLYSQDGLVKEYAVPPDPSTEKAEWILTTRDDADLGEGAWLCMDDPATGKAHGIIFEAGNGFTPGDDDGIQVKASVKEVVKLPGLEADAGSVYASRNAYERTGTHDTMLSDDLNVTFNTAFVTFETAGYEGVASEAAVFQDMAATRPVFRGNVTGEDDQMERFMLTAYVHAAPTVPLGSILSAVAGKNLSYLYAELYQEGGLQSSGSVGRLSLSEGMDLAFENTTLIEKIQLIVGLFDWGNASFFKKIRFPDLDPGPYLVKIYRENPLFRDEREYIGFTSVDVTENTSTHIFARPEGETRLTIVNQNGDGVQGATARLQYGNVTIAAAASDENGSLILRAPRIVRAAYTMQTLYKGFLMDEKMVRVQKRPEALMTTDEIAVSLYTYDVSIEDTWGLPPAVEVNPVLSSREMLEPVMLTATRQAPGSYRFTDLLPAGYTLQMGYKSFTLEEDVILDGDSTGQYMFPAEFEVAASLYNSYGMALSEGKLLVARSGQTLETDIDVEGTATFTVPPGTYTTSARVDGDEVAVQGITVKGDKSVAIITEQGSLAHLLVTIMGVVILVGAAALFLWKKDWMLSLHIGAVGVLVVSLASSWWTLTGSEGGISTATKTFLLPSSIVTVTSSAEALGGNISSIPGELSLVLTLIAGLLGLAAGLILVRMLFREKRPRLAAVLVGMNVILLVVSLLLFVYAMSQLTEVGVGEFMGSGDLEVSIPGDQAGSVMVSCSWGPGRGFYLGVLAMLLLTGVSMYRYRRLLLSGIGLARAKLARLPRLVHRT